MKCLTMALIVVPSCALSVKKENPHVISLSTKKAQHATSNPKYAHDCFKPLGKRVSHVLMQTDEGLPGAGIGKIVPFQTVLKDGFAEMDCFKDEMFYHGDKFHDHKASYTNQFNVSIVHYTSVVAKEDREEMTPEVCFDFCRTVPDMFGFGIVNGRDCYCAPYAKQMAGDSSQCDSVCPGDPSMFCGGVSKSQIWSMHMCADTQGELKTAGENLDKAIGELKAAAKRVETAAADGTKTSVELQKLFGCIGNRHAPDLLQKANVGAGVLEKAARAGLKLLDDMDATSKKAAKMLDSKADFTDFDKAQEAVALMKTMAKQTKDGSDMVPVLHKFLKFQDLAATDTGKKAITNRSDVYYHAYHFVHPETPKSKWDNDKSTCSGPLAAEPIYGLTQDECAYACDEISNDCKGIQWFSKHTGICFLLKEVEELFHYDMCAKALPEKCLPLVIKGKEDPNAKKLLLAETKATPIPWKVKSAEPNATLFMESVKGMCTLCDGCGSGSTPIYDCSLMNTYKCEDVSHKEISESGGTTSMAFNAYLASGRRPNACSVNANPCPRCKQFSTCAGPYATTEPTEIKVGDVASYTWSSSGATDDYEVFVGLYSETCGLVDYQFQRGQRQPMKTFELFSPKTDKYYMKFMLASYDGSGGGAVGADMQIKDIKVTKATIPKIVVAGASSKCMVRAADFFGTTIKPKVASKQCLKPDGTFPLGDNRCGIPEKK